MELFLPLDLGAQTHTQGSLEFSNGMTQMEIGFSREILSWVKTHMTTRVTQSRYLMTALSLLLIPLAALRPTKTGTFEYMTGTDKTGSSVATILVGSRREMLVAIFPCPQMVRP